MALTRILGLSKSPSLHHCRRTFSTARVVYPSTINRDSKACSRKRLIGPFYRNFCASPVVSDDMQISVTEDLIYSVKSLRIDVELLRKEVSLLSEEVRTIKKCDPIGSYSEEKMSDFSKAMATHFNTNIVMKTQDNKAAEKMSTDDLEKPTEKKSDFSEALATNFNVNLAAQNMDDYSEEIYDSDTEEKNEKTTEEAMSYYHTGKPAEEEKRDTEEKNEKATEEAMAMATHYTEIQKSDIEEGNKKTVPDGKEQNPLLKEIESEISLAEKFCQVSSQSRILPDDFPFVVHYDHDASAPIYLTGKTKSECIIVTVKPPSVFTCITAENYDYHKSSNFIMHLHVLIKSTEWGEMSFDCSAYSTGFRIEKVSECYTYPGGLDFSELNSTLQTEFKKYLEMRGITASNTNILFGYMLDKANRAKLRHLYKFQELVKKA